MRAIALRERSLRASVFSTTRFTSSTSKAYTRMSSFASVFTTVRCADAPIQVEPHRREREPRAGRVLRDHVLDVTPVRGLAVGDQGPVVGGPVLRRGGV